MINFLKRGLRFASFIIRRWLRAKQIAIRSRFFLWLDINLCYQGETPLNFDAAQELSKSFTRTILKAGREDRVGRNDLKPGIFLVASLVEHRLKLDLLRAMCLRLLTPRSQHLALSIDITGRALPGNPMFGKTEPMLVHAEAAAHFRDVVTNALIARLVSSPDSKS